MKSTQAVDKERKAALGASIKQQQHYDRLEQAATQGGAAADEAMDLGATQALQQLYTGKGAGGGQSVDGLITVRITSPDGQDNLQLPQSATFGDLRAQGGRAEDGCEQPTQCAHCQVGRDARRGGLAVCACPPEAG